MLLLSSSSLLQRPNEMVFSRHRERLARVPTAASRRGSDIIANKYLARGFDTNYYGRESSYRVTDSVGRSVGPSVCLSVCLSVGRSVGAGGWLCGLHAHGARNILDGWVAALVTRPCLVTFVVVVNDISAPDGEKNIIIFCVICRVRGANNNNETFHYRMRRSGVCHEYTSQYNIIIRASSC